MSLQFALKWHKLICAVCKQMKKTNVEILVEDIARSIVDSWLRLDEVNIKFQMDIEKIKESRVYLPKISEGPISMKEEALFDENNFYEQVLDIDNIDNDQQTKNSVFEYYFSEQKAVFELMYPDLSYNEIRINALACFKHLTKQDKVFYMKKYLKAKIYKRSGKGGANQDQYNQRQSNNYRFSDIQQNSDIPSLFDRMDNASSSNEPMIIQEFYSKNDFQGSISREKSGEPSGSIFKRMLFNSHGHNTNKAKPGSSQPLSSDKTGSKPDESKQQPQFQVLRSLYKRLQSSN